MSIVQLSHRRVLALNYLICDRVHSSLNGLYVHYMHQFRRGKQADDGSKCKQNRNVFLLTLISGN